MNAADPTSTGWMEGVWIDALAFVVGLGCAWTFGWSTTDLVWSLWLSSLVVGYAMIVWMVTSPARRAFVQSAAKGNYGAGVAGAAIIGVGCLFVLAFFTVHFGGFHYVHSRFLNQFFPLEPGVKQLGFFAMIGVAMSRYWWFLPAAALAERQVFLQPSVVPLDTAVTAEAITQRKAASNRMFEPYLNVMRMHFLIFFFAFAHFAKLDNFLVYAVAYAAYFFPWRILKRRGAAVIAVRDAAEGGEVLERR